MADQLKKSVEVKSLEVKSVEDISVPIMKFRVQLDNSYAELPDIVQQSLRENKYCYYKTEFGGYIFTTRCQIAVEPIDGNTPVFVVGQLQHDVINLNSSISDLYYLSYETAPKNIIIGDCQFKILLDKKNMLRVRQIEESMD